MTSRADELRPQLVCALCTFHFLQANDLVYLSPKIADRADEKGGVYSFDYAFHLGLCRLRESFVCDSSSP